MPLNSLPPTTTRANLMVKRRAAEGQVWTDVGFWGGVIPGNEGGLEMVSGDGVKGFKCFLVDSEVPEFPHVTEPDLRRALRHLRSLPTRLLLHAELAVADVQTEPSPPPHSHGEDTYSYSTFLASRPDASELAAIDNGPRIRAKMALFCAVPEIFHTVWAQLEEREVAVPAKDADPQCISPISTRSLLVYPSETTLLIFHRDICSRASA
ncbi:hypothetical protein DACRYDRAFT_22158 [Dacryopinax primogenitus]|uniref:Uncharacterized protein n=1 Tax=Dacryopinax primogenitus (strain DJM 731) TaxID=1858805 RepID=M5G0T5_DACPD|nr:uncharacterized protein DACRYDRAFT_22158 [Dacryopinax primogenitus]EJU01735.1 hypothetical protein DACRYDRAFT_22158 [Dacryopinax primogenitus]